MKSIISNTFFNAGFEFGAKLLYHFKILRYSNLKMEKDEILWNNVIEFYFVTNLRFETNRGIGLVLFNLLTTYTVFSKSNSLKAEKNDPYV